MKGSKALNITLLILKIIAVALLVAVVAFYIWCIIDIKNSTSTFAALGILVVIIYGAIGNITSFVISFVGLIIATISKIRLSKMEEINQELVAKRKKDSAVFLLLIVGAVVISIIEIILLNVLF